MIKSLSLKIAFRSRNDLIPKWYRIAHEITAAEGLCFLEVLPSVSCILPERNTCFRSIETLARASGIYVASKSIFLFVLQLAYEWIKYLK